MKPDCAVLKASDYEVANVPLRFCQRMVADHHYAQGGSNTGTFCHGLYLRGSWKRLGIAWWLPPIKKAALGAWNWKPYDGVKGTWQEVLALTRLAILPGTPQNAATFLIARSIRMIQKDGRYRCLISFADEWQQHDGTIYKAGNWEECGYTDPSPVWLDENGRMVSLKATKSRTQAQMAALGYRMIGKFRKKRFRIILPPARIVNACPEHPSLFCNPA